MPSLNKAIADLVTEDHVAREATDETGAVHMIYWTGTRVQSTLLADWPAVQLELAAKEAERQAAAQLRQQIVTTAQSAVGVRLSDLTAAQRNSLIALLLWKAGGVKNDATIAPLVEWVK